MIAVLTYLTLICGGLLLVLLLLSILGGLDLDLDIDTDAGGLGYVKGALTFVSLGAWVVRLTLLSEVDPWVAFLVGAAAGAVGVWILHLLLRFLLSQQAEVNWSAREALTQQGRVYLRIPAGGEGIVQVEIGGAKRELKARSRLDEDIPTGAPVVVEEVTENGLLTVSPLPQSETTYAF